MDVFLLSLMAVFAIALGGRDAAVIAALADRLGRAPLLLVVGIACAGVSAGVMAWAGGRMADWLPYRAAQMLVAFALGFAALELALPVKREAPAEPTRSLGAIALVLLARQLGDAARFVVFAFAALAHLPWVSGLGGALAGAGALALAWSLGAEGLARYRPAVWRRLLAALCALSGVLIGLDARLGAF
jgi:putative Ca2+/H+ antiporter (TMEM165/GDT1 family)